MAELTQWRGFAQAHSGNIVVWINQSRAQNLKAVNSNGVCKAITMDWIASYRRYLSDRARFVNKFRAYDAEGNLVTVIPDEFIARQGVFTAQLQLDNIQYRKALAAYKNNPTPQGLKQANDIVRRARGGPDCLAFYRLKDINDVVTRLGKLTNSAAYFALALTRPGGGHVIGFELRPDRDISENYPKLYEYLDANTGLFAFKALKDMLDFVQQKVWPKQGSWAGYGTFTGFMLLHYNIGLGGFGLSPEEQLELDFADLELELEFEALGKELEERYGKDWWKKK